MARIGPIMRSIRRLLMGWAPKSLPIPRTRHWATPICHNSHNIQEFMHTIKSTTKARATKAQ
jgi:hypothetical protein